VTMRKPLRIIIVAVGALVLAVVALALVVPRLLDPNAYKDQISDLVRSRTGHELTISGDIRLAVFPWVALEVDHVQLSSAPGFGAAPLVQVGHASMRIKLLPLLSKQVRMGTISLDDVVVHLARDAQGRSNWQDLGSTAATPTSPDTATGDGAGSVLALLEIGGIELRNARLDWDDKRTGHYYQFSDINVLTGRYSPGKSFDIDIVCAVASGRDALARPMRLTSTVNADPATQRYQLRKAKLEVGLPGGGTATLTTDLDVDLAQQHLVMPAIAFQAYALKLTGNLQGVHVLDDPDLRGALHLAEFNPRELLLALGEPVPKAVDLAVMTKASADFNLRAGRDQVTLQPLALQLDDSTLTGEFTVSDFAKPRLGFALEVDDINVDRYLPPPPEQSADAAIPAAPWPVEALRALNLDGTLHIGHLQAYRLHSAGLRVIVNTALKD